MYISGDDPMKKELKCACCGMDIIAHVDCILLQSCLSWTSGYVDQVRKHKK